MPHLRSLLTLPSARTAAALLTVVATSVTLGACTSSGSSTAAKLDGEEGRVQDVLTTFSDYADDEKAQQICTELLTDELRAALSKGGECKDVVQKTVDATDLTALDVDTVKITGTTAVATILKTKRATNQTKIVLEQAAAKGPWKISAFGNEAAGEVAGSTPDAAATTPESTTPDASPTATPKA